jgi:hypothetical protein
VLAIVTLLEEEKLKEQIGTAEDHQDLGCL